MKKVAILCLILLMTSFVFATERTTNEIIAYAMQTPEQLANLIIETKLNGIYRVGFVELHEDPFLLEIDVHYYETALYSPDNKLKALIAIKALGREPTHEFGISVEERLKRKLKWDREYKKLKDWYMELSKEVK